MKFSGKRENRDWVKQANCRLVDPESLFVSPAEQEEAARICHTCPVYIPCALDAMVNKIEFGIWGGMTEKDRRRLRRKYPKDTDWHEYFEEGVLVHDPQA